MTSLSLVRYHTNDYSVPTEYGHRQVLIKGYVDKVVICAGSEEIARHRRSYGREELIFHPLHYLALLERKTGALEQAAPLEGWQLLEARDDKRLLRLQKQLAKQDLLIVDELGYVPLSKTGSELLFEIFSQRYERASTLVTSNLPFNEWTEIFGSERLTGALLDRLTHHVHILEMNGESYRLQHSKRSRKRSSSP